MKKRNNNIVLGLFGEHQLLIRNFILALLIFFAFSILLVYITNGLKRLSYFKIKEVIIKNQEPIDLLYLKGRNIFDLDLKCETNLISGMYPAYKKIRLIKILPDKLFLDFLVRRPVALVKSWKLLGMDETLSLFDIKLAPEDASRFPVITGLERKIATDKPGRKYAIPELSFALNIIKRKAEINSLNGFSIKRIDLFSFDSVLIFLDNGLEVRIGHENLRQKFDLLGGILANLKNDLRKISYIDLRFKESVIKFYNDK